MSRIVALSCLGCTAVLAIIVGIVPGPATAGPLTQEAGLVREMQRVARPITGSDRDYDRLLAAIGDARIVLLGEDTHGTREHYLERARITQRLIVERGFGAVVIEGDAVPAAIVNGALRKDGSDHNIDLALRAFDRFPRWMWRNDEFFELLRSIRAINLHRSESDAVVVGGMDVYDLARPVAAVLAYLQERDPSVARRSKDRYDCFATIDMTPQRYGELLDAPVRTTCEAPVIEALAELATMGPSQSVDLTAGVAHHAALQSARAIVASEAYFRALHDDPAHSWNVRDAHMAAFVSLLLAELERRADGARPGIVVWAHNAHIGDARATSRGESGDWSLGQLLRERFPDRVFSIGFTTARGSVHAATEWGEPGMSKRLSRPPPGSHGALLGRVRPRFYLVFADSRRAREMLARPRLQRGIGVRYLPLLEREGHYFSARLSLQFDAIVHIDRTSALHPRIID